jgi:hypothetical protein
LPTTRALGILPKLGHGFAQLGAICIMKFEVRFYVVSDFDVGPQVMEG